MAFQKNIRRRGANAESVTPEEMAAAKGGGTAPIPRMDDGDDGSDDNGTAYPAFFEEAKTQTSDWITNLDPMAMVSSAAKMLPWWAWLGIGVAGTYYLFVHRPAAKKKMAA